MQAGMNESYLIFSIKNTKWALPSSSVQEIVHAAKIHPLPFVPEYVEGVVNCRGLPYTVVNTVAMEGEDNATISGTMVLVLKRDDDQLAIHISDIDLFFEPEEEDLRADGVRYKKQIIPLFDADAVEEQLVKDLTEEES